MNPYYDVNDRPNEVGLFSLGGLSDYRGSYEFHIMLVVQHAPSGRIFYAEDAGCSCPTPFEDFYFASPEGTNLQEIKIGDSFMSFQREVESFPASQEERDDLLSRVKAALK